MYSTNEFASLENMRRELAALAKKEMHYLLTEYWLAEAEEWRQLSLTHSKKALRTASHALSEQQPNANDTRWEKIAGASRLGEM